MKRFAVLTAAVSTAVTICTLALVASASAQSSLPTVNVTVTGTNTIAISGSLVSGAVNIVATDAGGSGSFALIRLNPNQPASTAIDEGLGAVQAHGGDPNALTAVGDPIVVSADAPGTVQAELTPGNWLAVNISGQGAGGFAPFTVAASSTPAALPTPSATLASIEFGFRGPKVLHDGTVVREVNDGFLVHMNDLIGVKSKRDGKKVIAGLLAGKGPGRLRKYLTGVFVDLMDPASPGALQQETLNVRRGYYVEACFMNTEDGREHTQLGMERLIKVVN